MIRRFAFVLPILLASPLAWPLAFSADDPPAKKEKITWKRVVVDKSFRSEGVAVADFNKDGHMDIFVGDVWYEGPDFKKVHVVRRDKPYDPLNYSEAFACFAGDFNGDGWPDVIVIPFPGKPCHWYENPGAKGGKWKEHVLAENACNETPIYVDLFKTGKKVLVMGWQPPGSKGDQGQMCYFTPGDDPTKLWERHPISEASQPGKEIPGTRQFSHGLGRGDVNGDGRFDILCTGGWWEQPEKPDGKTPWKFHPANLGPDCADMFAFDVDGDGKADIISTSAHNYGFWWHQQKAGKDGPTFVRRDLFQSPITLAKVPQDLNLSDEETALFKLINKARAEALHAPWRLNVTLCHAARKHANSKPGGTPSGSQVSKPINGIWVNGRLVAQVKDDTEAEKKALELVRGAARLYVTSKPGIELGLGYSKGDDGNNFLVLYLGETGAFSLPAQTHALHFTDINGDGLKDFVTGRRWWAHGPKKDADPGDPAVLHWFEAKKDKDGYTTFIPHLIDDDSGIGTQFEVIDMNGDGLPDIVISNKKGVFVFIQVRSKE